MKFARIIYPVKVLGPGDRAGIWLAGCPHRCDGCSNPELWDAASFQDINPVIVVETIKQITNNQLNGVTITGGEPFTQIDELCTLVEALHTVTNDILVYTGYTIEELESLGNVRTRQILKNITVLIDGRYIEKENLNRPLVGSSNQVIHYIKPEYSEIYQKYISDMNGKSLIQNFASGNSVISVGIHSPQFNDDFGKLMVEHGLSVSKEEFS